MSSATYRENRILKKALVACITKQLELADKYLAYAKHVDTVWVFDAKSLFKDADVLVEDGIRVQCVKKVSEPGWSLYETVFIHYGILSDTLQNSLSSPKNRRLLEKLFKSTKFHSRLYYCEGGVFLYRF